MTKSIFTEKYLRMRRLLVQERKAKGLSQAEVAKQLNRPQSFVSKYELGERRLDVVEFLEVTQALGVAAHELLQKIQAGTNARKKAKL